MLACLLRHPTDTICGPVCEACACPSHAWAISPQGSKDCQQGGGHSTLPEAGLVCWWGPSIRCTHYPSKDARLPHHLCTGCWLRYILPSGAAGPGCTAASCLAACTEGAIMTSCSGSQPVLGAVLHTHLQLAGGQSHVAAPACRQQPAHNTETTAGHHRDFHGRLPHVA
jgi:hypothetical protein